MVRSTPPVLCQPKLIVVAIVFFALSIFSPTIELCDAHHFGFRGGFRGGFGRSFSGFRGRGIHRVGRFRSFGFRGFRNFGRSRFNSLAFRGRRFGGSRFRTGFRGVSRFGGFNRFNNFNRFRSFNRFGSVGRFNNFSSRRFVSSRSIPSRSFAFSHFPTNRFHSGFRTFSASPVRYTSVPRTLVASSKVVAGQGWNQLATSDWTGAGNSFATKIDSGIDPGASRIGYALAKASSGDLDQGVWAMKRAFELNMPEINSMMFEEELLPAVEAVTRIYETRMENNNNSGDDAFMLAALYQMQGDPEMAAMAADYVRKANLNDAAALNLTAMIDHEMHSLPMAGGKGWDYLAQGRSAEAVNEFVKEINANTQAGVPKLGYAIANAALGDMPQAVWALRRAFEFDAEGVSDVMLDGALRPVLQQITAKYEQEVETNGVNKDNSLVLATLYQLQGDMEGAEFLVSTDTMGPDLYVTKMIKEEMAMEKEMMAEMMPEDSVPPPPTIILHSSIEPDVLELTPPEE